MDGLLRVCTVNALGLNDIQKRNLFFNMLSKSDYNIFFLQETHASIQNVPLWSGEWQGPSYWNCATSQSRGVAILFKPNVNFKMENIIKDVNGRYLSITIQYECQKLQLSNLYAPNTLIREENEAFFDFVQAQLRSDLPQIIGGDFNMVEDLDLDRKGGTKKEKHRWGLEALKQMKHDYNLVDIWRIQNPQKKCYSWHSFSQNIQSRLDRF